MNWHLQKSKGIAIPRGPFANLISVHRDKCLELRQLSAAVLLRTAPSTILPCSASLISPSSSRTFPLKSITRGHFPKTPITALKERAGLGVHRQAAQHRFLIRSWHSWRQAGGLKNTSSNMSTLLMRLRIQPMNHQLLSGCLRKRPTYFKSMRFNIMTGLYKSQLWNYSLDIMCLTHFNSTLISWNAFLP